jgi:hypothetical protein
VEHEAEFEKLISRGSDYDELLRADYVVRRPDDVEEWRRDMRAQARSDKLRIRTGVAEGDDSTAWALLHRPERDMDDQEMADFRSRQDTVREAMSRAGLRGHKVDRVIRSENRQAAAVCRRCGARMYVDWRAGPAFMEGEVFDVDCA